MIIKTIKYVVFALGIVVIHGCNTVVDKPKTNIIKDKDGKIISGDFTEFWDNGNVSAEMTFKDRKLHGPALRYYIDGKKRSELNYNIGELDGIQKRYYKSGALYKEESFVNGKRQGLTRKFREGGLIMTETIYKNGFPSTELKEYLTDGKLKKNYPEIVVIEEESLRKNGTLTIKVFLSDKSKKVRFYLGKLDEGKFLHEGLAEQFGIENGVLSYTFSLKPGDLLEHQFDFIARTPTKLNNSFITTRSYKVKIRFPR
jgi:hypothetical protein